MTIGTRLYIVFVMWLYGLLALVPAIVVITAGFVVMLLSYDENSYRGPGSAMALFGGAAALFCWLLILFSSSMTSSESGRRIEPNCTALFFTFGAIAATVMGVASGGVPWWVWLAVPPIPAFLATFVPWPRVSRLAVTALAAVAAALAAYVVPG